MKTNESTAETGSAPVGLNLELGHGSDHSTKSCCFTILQLQELQLQALIYKYMEAALPVPYNLLLPLWKSVSSSLGVLNDAVPLGHTSCKYPKSSPFGNCSDDMLHGLQDSVLNITNLLQFALLSFEI